jgi:hypothetical protein
MNNIKIIKTGINVSKILRQLKEHPEDWGSQRNIEGARSIVEDFGFDSDAVEDLAQKLVGIITENQINEDIDILSFLEANKSELIDKLAVKFEWDEDDKETMGEEE